MSRWSGDARSASATTSSLSRHANHEIERVFSHPVALAQCRRFLAEHPAMKAIAFYDTAGSVKQLVELGDRHAAAIASRGSRQITMAPDSRRRTSRTTQKTTPDFSWCARSASSSLDPQVEQDQPGILGRESARFVGCGTDRAFRLGTNLTKIESRPVQGKPWEYIFYVDCQIVVEEGTRALKHSAPLRHGEGTGTDTGGRRQRARTSNESSVNDRLFSSSWRARPKAEAKGGLGGRLRGQPNSKMGRPAAHPI